ncbi:MAG: biotin-dependent carboxyltransferase family protein [Cyclobacteriaceae bacterium]
MGKVTFHKPGLYTSIQDLGRFGYRHLGVPVSGTMDQERSAMANLLVNNEPNNPIIEVTMLGPELTFSEPASISICGADISPNVNDAPISLNKAHHINAGDKLVFGKLKYGLRCYIAIHGLKSDKVLGSASQYSGVTQKPRIEMGDSFKYKTLKIAASKFASVQFDQSWIDDLYFDCFIGSEYHLLRPKMRQVILNQNLTIELNDRMGYQFAPQASLQNELSITTSNTLPGTVQLTPSGKLIVLMRDGQVTGGYPRVLQLSEASINKLSQQTSGKSIRFRVMEK